MSQMMRALGLIVILLILGSPPMAASAPAGDIFGPACGAAVIDGVIVPGEWSSASTRTFQMVNPRGGEPFTATLYVMNSARYLYMGITINDDEFSTYAQYLPGGDAFRIDFDNDHSGAIYAIGDDVLSVAAGLPQFEDSFIVAATSSNRDAEHGGSTDGAGAASRVGNLNHFELRHPLCSGDALDFCLHPGDVVGFRLEYLDAQSDGTFGSNQFFPGREATSVAEIVISPCSAPDYSVYLPLARR
jgi:hypothetical protein